MAKADDKFKIADYIKEFAIQVGNVKNKINNINQNKFLKNSLEYTEESFDYFVNKNLREVFEDFYKYLKKLGPAKTKETVFPLSLCFYNQDWDYIFEVLKDSIGDMLFEFRKLNSDKKTEDIVNVKSWGHIYQNYDANLLKHIRNGLAHSKFDYDAKTQKIVINMYKETFVVEIDLDFLTQLTMELWQIIEDINFKESKQPVVMYKDYEFKKAVLLSIKDGKMIESKTFENLEKLGLSKADVDRVMAVVAICCANENFTLVDKLKTSGNFINKYTESAGLSENTTEITKLIFEAFGLEVEELKEIDIENDLYKNNLFLKAYAFNMLNSNQLTMDEKQKNLTRAINMKYYDLNRNFTAYVNLLTMISDAGDYGWGKFRNELKSTNIPFSMDEISLLVDKSYFNYIYNYLSEKCGKPQGLEKVLATKYFAENDFTKDISLADVFTSIRNCVVHPNRLILNNGVYKMTDYDNRGDLAFEAEISREEFIELTNLVNKLLQKENDKTKKESKKDEDVSISMQ